ncbi:MAG: hypothetical protein JWM82_2522, partial [Myxococcales bacterium]|nr:hypothetical protein [Myxococcales bacterium]
MTAGTTLDLPACPCNLCAMRTSSASVATVLMLGAALAAPACGKKSQLASSQAKGDLSQAVVEVGDNVITV